MQAERYCKPNDIIVIPEAGVAPFYLSINVRRAFLKGYLSLLVSDL